MYCMEAVEHMPEEETSVKYTQMEHGSDSDPYNDEHHPEVALPLIYINKICGST